MILSRLCRKHTRRLVAIFIAKKLGATTLRAMEGQISGIKWRTLSHFSSLKSTDQYDMLTCQADTHYLHTELEISLLKQADRLKLKKTHTQNCRLSSYSSKPTAMQCDSLSEWNGYIHFSLKHVHSIDDVLSASDNDWHCHFKQDPVMSNTGYPQQAWGEQVFSLSGCLWAQGFVWHGPNGHECWTRHSRSATFYGSPVL
jgi:hypothetical protein